eukprot:3878992-Amphidinium_carterae.1
MRSSHDFPSNPRYQSSVRQHEKQYSSPRVRARMGRWCLDPVPDLRSTSPKRALKKSSCQ